MAVDDARADRPGPEQAAGTRPAARPESSPSPGNTVRNGPTAASADTTSPRRPSDPTAPSTNSPTQHHGSGDTAADTNSPNRHPGNGDSAGRPSGTARRPGHGDAGADGNGSHQLGDDGASTGIAALAGIEALADAATAAEVSEALENTSTPSLGARTAATLLSSTPAAEAGLSLLAREFTSLAGSLLNATTVAGVLSRVVETAIAVVPGADLVSVTLRIGKGRFVTPVQTDQLASALDEIQYDANEGPCVDATRTPGLGVTSCPDLKSDSPWTVFGPKAADAGVRAVFAAGLFPESGPPRMGALNFYSYTPNGLDGVDQDIALLLAAHASVALAGTQAITAAELEAVQLRQALESRDVIGQAKGILMQRRGVTADEAFDILRDASQNLNMKLADIARTVAERHPSL